MLNRLSSVLKIAVVIAVVVLSGCDDLVLLLTPSPQPACSGLPTLAPDANYQTAEVTKIVDGDTIDVEIEGKTYRLRYIGMDTPERGRPFFSEATEANRQLVANQTVYLEKDVFETDRYDRLLRYVYLQDGRMVNAELVCQGFAQVATFPPDVKYQETFLQLQREARDAGRGLWGE